MRRVITFALLLVVLLISAFSCQRSPDDEILLLHVESLSTTSTNVLLGESIALNARVRNSGSDASTLSVRLVSGSRILEERRVHVAGDAVVDVEFRYLPESWGVETLSVGDKRVTLSVLRPAEFQYRCLVISPEGVTEGETLTISLVAFNVGDVAGTADLDLIVDGRVVARAQVAAEQGRMQTTVRFQYAPVNAGVGHVALGGQTSSFLVRPANGELVDGPKSLTDIRVLQPRGLDQRFPFQFGGLTHVHGAAYDAGRNTLWVSELLLIDLNKQYENHLYEFDLSACQEGSPTAVTHIRLGQVLTEDKIIEELGFDPSTDTVYYLTHDGTLVQVNRSGTELGSWSMGTALQDAGNVISPDGSIASHWWGLTLQGDVIWVSNGRAVFQLDKVTKQFTGVILDTKKVGLAFDSDRNLLWTGNWEDGVFEAWDPETQEIVYRSPVLQFPHLVNTVAPNCCGHNLAYGGGRLWFGSENLDVEYLFGVRVE